jgi:hypothetical protein
MEVGEIDYKLLLKDLQLNECKHRNFNDLKKENNGK